MSASPPESPAPATPPPGAIRCARCGADVPAEADWCLECGLAARTRVAPIPRWRVPLVGAAVLAALALAALALAFVDLTEDPEPAATTTAPVTAPATAPVAPAPVPTTTAPIATAPAAPPAPEAEPTATAPAAPVPAPAPEEPGGAEAPAE